MKCITLHLDTMTYVAMSAAAAHRCNRRFHCQIAALLFDWHLPIIVCWLGSAVQPAEEEHVVSIACQVSVFHENGLGYR